MIIILLFLVYLLAVILCFLVFLFYVVSLISFLRGLIPRVCAQRTAEGEGFLLLKSGAEQGGPIYFHVGYISLRDEQP